MRSIALDIGTKNIGIAITDLNKKFITILPKIEINHNSRRKELFNEKDVNYKKNISKIKFDAKDVFNLLKEKLLSYWDEIDQIIIGNSEDVEYENNKTIVSCQNQLYRVLKIYTDWEIFEECEIYTSVESFKILKNLNFSPKKIKKHIDSCAAAIMLSNFFLNNGKEIIMGF